MDQPPLRTYGRTKARTLKPRQAALVEALLPHLALPEEGAIDVEALFGAAPTLSLAERVAAQRRGEGRADSQAPERLHAPHPAAARQPSPRGRGWKCGRSKHYSTWRTLNVIPGRRAATNPEPRGQRRASYPWVPDRDFVASGMTT